MQWSASAQAGFTTGTAWRAPNSDYVTSNVEAMQLDGSSLWNHYRRLIHARNESLALRQGGYYPVDATATAIFAFLRVKESEAILVVHNTSKVALSSTLSAAASGMASGTYNASDFLTGDELGTLNVSIADSKIESYDKGTAFAGHSVTLIKLVKQ
jgi:glycosidase